MFDSTVLVLVGGDWGSWEQGTALDGSQWVEALLDQGIEGSTPQGEQ